MDKIFLTLVFGVILLFQTVAFGNFHAAEAAENIDVAVYQASSFECENEKHCFEWWLDYVEDSWRRVPGSVQVQYLDPDVGWISRDVQLFSGVGKVLIVVDKKVNQAKIIGFVEPNTRAKYVGDGDLLTFGSFQKTESQTTDVMPPVLNVPENIVQSTAAESALVLFSVTAVDDVDGKIIPVCSHENGDKFPIGKTVVTCTATDSAGNSVTESFTVTIKRWPGTLGHGADPGVSSGSGEIFDDFDDLETETKSTLPPQQKQVFKWWADGLVSDEEMMNSITYMFEAQIITSDKIEITEFETSDDLGPIKKSTFPPQQKQVLQWWAEGLVSDEEVMNNITYLFETETLQSEKIKIKNFNYGTITQTDPYNYGTITQIDPNSDEWIDFDKEIIKRTYESQKWNQAIAKLLVGVKDAQVDVLEDAQREITSIYSQDNNPAALNELVEVKDAIKQVNNEASQAVKFLSKITRLVEETELIANSAGIHVSELANSVSEQQEIIDSVIPELETASDFEDAYKEIENTKVISSAFTDSAFDKTFETDWNLKPDGNDSDRNIRNVFFFTFETEAELENAVRNFLTKQVYDFSLQSPKYEGGLDVSINFEEIKEKYIKLIGKEKYDKISNELKEKFSNSNNSKDPPVDETDSVVDELGGIIIDYGSPYGYDPKTGKPYDPPPKKPALILEEYELNNIENQKVLEVLTPGFLDSLKIEPLLEDEPRIAQDLDIDEELIEDTTQDDEPLQETTPAPPQEPVTGDAALYRLVSAYDHFYTTDVNEKNNAYGYAFERIEAYIFSTQEPGTVPLYRLFNGIDHFYLIDSAERSTAMSLYGYVDEGIEGYVYPTQEPGTVPLYRLVSGTNHFYTTDLTEKNNAVAYLNYIDEGIECYVFPNN